MSCFQTSLFRLLILALIGMLSPVAFCESKPDVKTLVLAAEDDAGPWSLADGSGFANDVVLAAYKSVGVDVKLEVMPYARCKHLVLEGEVAGCFSMSKAPDTEKALLFADEPLFVCKSDFFQAIDRPVVKKGADLPKGTKVGAVEGYEYPDAVDQLQERGVIVIENSPSEELNLKKLADHRIDAALLNYNEVKSISLMLANSRTTGKIELAQSGGLLNSYIAFSRKHASGAWAAEKFNAGMKAIKEDGTLKKIQDKWADVAKKETEAALKASKDQKPTTSVDDSQKNDTRR